MCNIGVIEGKIEKEGKMSFSICIFIYTIHLAYLKVYTKFENTGSKRNREICDRNFHWREREMNQGTINNRGARDSKIGKKWPESSRILDYILS